MADASTTRHYVGRGMVRAASAPGVLSATVGPGYAVCVSFAGGRLGGMAHIGCDGRDAAAQLREIELGLAALWRSSARLGKVEHPVAVVAGGADVLGLFPRHVWARMTARQTELVAGVLEMYHARITRMRVGGSVARRVQLELPGGTVSVRFVGARGRSRAVTPVRGGTLVASPAEPGPPREVVAPELTVDMGRLLVARAPARLTAVLGSCVGLVMLDAESGIGGMAHVMMPRQNGSGEDPARFADTAVGALVEALLEKGASRAALRAKLVGGANVLGAGGPLGVFRIGDENVATSRGALAQEGIPLLWEDVGGGSGRKVRVHLADFRVEVKRLAPVRGPDDRSMAR